VADSYDTLAGVYEWLVPEPLRTPRGAAEAFAGIVRTFDAGARILDCAAGTGQLAVGLALAGFEVVASDASAAMVRRTRALAARHAVDVPAVRCSWEELAAQGWRESFDAVFCVGNSLTHAAGKTGRRAALRAMAGVLRAGGLLVVTSRNWERVRDKGSGLEVADQLAVLDGERALVVHAWTIPRRWDEPHFLDVAVARIDDSGGVTTSGEKLPFWPFRVDELAADLRSAGLDPRTSTYHDRDERYLVTACRPGPASAAGTR
jgi:SAM-dependent methyltransferase